MANEIFLQIFNPDLLRKSEVASCFFLLWCVFADLLLHNKDVVNFCHRPLPREKTAADHLGPGLYQLSGTTVVLFEFS